MNLKDKSSEFLLW